MRPENEPPTRAKLRTALIIFHRWLALATSAFILTDQPLGIAMRFPEDRTLGDVLGKPTEVVSPSAVR